MKEQMVAMRRRPAQTYILNLECECGGTYEVVRPIKTDIATETVLHRCSKCKNEIYVDGIYPCTTAISDAESEPYGTKSVLTK